MSDNKTYKIVISGGYGSGKTALIRAIKGKEFEPSLFKEGSDAYHKTHAVVIQTNKGPIRVKLWDVNYILFGFKEDWYTGVHAHIKLRKPADWQMPGSEFVGKYNYIAVGFSDVIELKRCILTEEDPVEIHQPYRYSAVTGEGVKELLNIVLRDVTLMEDLEVETL